MNIELLNGGKTSAPKQVLKHSLKRFAREEDGVVTAMGLFFVLMMCLVGGIGVDLMRNELERTNVQSTLDRAVIAASDMEQSLSPEEVVRDYFAKSGLTEFLVDSSINVADSVNGRRVSATARGTTKNMFMSVMGRSTLPVYARSSAAEGVSSIEVSLVLDISGSMSGRKNEEMRRAGGEFLDIVLAPDQRDTVTVSLVPYNGKVNAGSLVNDYFEVTREHSHANCFNFSDQQFEIAGLTNGDPARRLAHFDKDSNEFTDILLNPHCQTNEYGAIKPWSNDPDALKAHINTLGASGWTAIDLGMKWATILLDPSSQDELSDMATDGHVRPQFVGRPANYYDTERPVEESTMKVVVLMTDGANTNQYDLKEEFKTGVSDIFVALDPDNEMDPAVNKYSVYDPILEQYYWLEEKTWNPLPKGVATQADLTDGGFVSRLNNVNVFARWPINYIAAEFYGDFEYQSVAGTARYSEISTAAELTAQQAIGDVNLHAICNAAKSEGIIVFAVAFEAPEGGVQALQDCASTEAHFFDADGAELSTAFGSIARQISQLRLTE